MRSITTKTARALLQITFAATGVVAVAMGINALLEFIHAVPRVGDIVAFTLTSPQYGDEDTRLIVRRQDQFGCVLDMGVLRDYGGSIVVESQIGSDGKGFRVHWAGDHTSAGASNCGNEAELIVDQHDMDVLALTAGGYGIGPKRGMHFADAEIYSTAR